MPLWFKEKFLAAIKFSTGTAGFQPASSFMNPADWKPALLAESIQSKLGRINAEAQRTQRDAENCSFSSRHLTVSSANHFFPLRFSAFSASLRLSGWFQ